MIPWSVRFFKAGLNPLHVFYTNYVKNLCHSIYLIERKINEVLLVKRQFVPRLPLSYLQARKVTANSVDETSLR